MVLELQDTGQLFFETIPQNLLCQTVEVILDPGMKPGIVCTQANGKYGEAFDEGEDLSSRIDIIYHRVGIQLRLR